MLLSERMYGDNESQVWMTKAEAAERLRLSTRTIDRLAKAGRLPSYRQGTDIRRFKTVDVDALMQRERSG